MSENSSGKKLWFEALSALDRFRDELVSEDPFKREFAYASFVALGYEEFALKLITIKKDSAGRAVAQDVKASGSPAAKAEAEATLQSIPALVYLQIGSEAQRELAGKIRAVLQQQGYEVPEIENVAGKAIMPLRTNVRYFNDQ